MREEWKEQKTRLGREKKRKEGNARSRINIPVFIQYL